MAIFHATKDNFDELLNTEYAIVDFYGDFCGACVELAPIFTAASNDYAALRFIKVNTSVERELSERFDIHYIPATIYFRNGEPVARAVGSMSREKLDQFIASLLYEYPAPEMDEEEE